MIKINPADLGSYATVKVNGLTFEEWYNKVNDYVVAQAGVGIEDLADGPSFDCWQGEYSPEEYAEEQLYSEGFYGF